MSTSSDGARHESRATTILERMGWMLAAEARRVPIWRNGRVVSSLPVDIVPAGGDGTADGLYIHPARKILVLQVGTFGSNHESEKRQKLRAIMPKLPKDHVEVMLWMWERGPNHFRVFRDVDDFLEKGHRISMREPTFSWERPAETPTQTHLG